MSEAAPPDARPVYLCPTCTIVGSPLRDRPCAVCAGKMTAAEALAHAIKLDAAVDAVGSCGNTLYAPDPTAMRHRALRLLGLRLLARFEQWGPDGLRSTAECATACAFDGCSLTDSQCAALALLLRDAADILEGRAS